MPYKHNQVTNSCQQFRIVSSIVSAGQTAKKGFHETSVGTDKQVQHRVQTQTATSSLSDRTRRCGLDRTALLADAGKPYCRKSDSVKLSFVIA